MCGKTFVGSGYSMGRGYGGVERLYEQIWGIGGLHCHEG
jgi:hypothetical protein